MDHSDHHHHPHGGSVELAFLLSICSGLATCIGGLVVFVKRLVHLACAKTLAISLSLSAGVMIFISLTEIFGKSVESYKKGFETVVMNDTATCRKLGFHFTNVMEDGISHCSYCDAICDGHAWLAATATFVLGVSLIFGIDYVVGKISPAAHEEFEVCQLNKLQKNASSCDCEGIEKISIIKPAKNIEEGLPKDEEIFSGVSKQQLNRTGVLTAIAISLHNIPDGIATYIGTIGDTRIGAALAIGVALHNIPEGIAVAAPVYFATGSRFKAFMWALLSAIAEPVGAIIAWMIVGEGLNPYIEGIMFGIVCGMMITISFKELIPSAIKYHSDGNSVIFSILCGMGIMALSLILFAYAGAHDH